MVLQLIKDINFCLSDHPSVVHFRWSPTERWVSTWMFLITSISAYITLSATLHLLLRRRKPTPLGPLPALHSLAMVLLSAAIFAGTLASSLAEIRDTRWLWRRSKTTPFQWLLCFPLGTRPSGRVFFWSYVFYLSRFLHVSRTFLKILRNPEKFPLFQVANHSALICMSFLWLEFSQSIQVLAILSMTLVFALVYGCRFCAEIGRRRSCSFPFVMVCQVGLVVANFAWHIGVVVVYLWKGGCNGMGAWLFNALLNTFLLFFLLHFYVGKCLSERDFAASCRVDRKAS